SMSRVCWLLCVFLSFFFSSRRRHTRFSRDWSSDVCSSDLVHGRVADRGPGWRRPGPGAGGGRGAAGGDARPGGGASRPDAVRPRPERRSPADDAAAPAGGGGDVSAAAGARVAAVVGGVVRQAVEDAGASGVVLLDDGSAEARLAAEWCRAALGPERLFPVPPPSTGVVEALLAAVRGVVGVAPEAAAAEVHRLVGRLVAL